MSIAQMIVFAVIGIGLAATIAAIAVVAYLIVRDVRAPRWTPNPTCTYQWYRNGEPIPGATISTYVLQPGDEGQSIDFRVTYPDGAVR